MPPPSSPCTTIAPLSLPSSPAAGDSLLKPCPRQSGSAAFCFTRTPPPPLPRPPPTAVPVVPKKAAAGAPLPNLFPGHPG
ncbi:hypothetical protein E2562_000236 [Oryza meyeriana var. granulata]|uniref:Uncharacterized protein n=1 Tax=Oryza meyeriana var. granulata TaxID=110450 RepID=A0A6G1CMH1_9ORYZ|nr:hypothetical protein E2562_000236 [Oryza meyeriana var. granulata]